MRSPGLAVLLVALAAASASAQSVSMSGSLGHNALLVIDGKPRNVAVGATVAGVKLVSLAGDDAVVEIAGKRATLHLGGAQVNLGGKQSEGSGKQIVLTADGGGHFYTAGSINGKSVRFVVDTGATTVAIGQDEADRLGLDYKSGPRGLSRTANGVVPFYRTTLTSVRIGDVQVYNVEASILPVSMGQVLLGNSFLTRFQMKRENDVLTLDMRY
ncbi:MAG: retropepsin-like aspartic protease [Caldimonas sp.]